MGKNTEVHHANRLLAAMTPADFARLRPRLELVQLEPRSLLMEAGERIGYLYFPHSAVVCLMAVMRESGITETSSIGLEGVAGFEVLLGVPTAINRLLVQVPGPASRIPARDMIAAAKESTSLRALLLRYVGAFLVQTTQLVACNSLHRLEERCCRWLLLAHDRAQRDSFKLTQEFLAEMLGVHRPTVTIVARTLQAAGLIRYSRGVVTIVDRPGLEAASCECYTVVKDAHEAALSRESRA